MSREEEPSFVIRDPIYVKESTNCTSLLHSFLQWQPTNRMRVSNIGLQDAAAMIIHADTDRLILSVSSYYTYFGSADDDDLPLSHFCVDVRYACGTAVACS